MASTHSLPYPRLCVSGCLRSRVTSPIVAILLVATCVPTAAGRERPAPAPQELWRQFPLDDEQTRQTPTSEGLGERPTPISSGEAAESAGENLDVLGLATLAFVTVVVIACATGVLAGLRRRLRSGVGRNAYAPASRSIDLGRSGEAASGRRTQRAKQMHEVEILKLKREADRRAARPSASSFDKVDTLRAKLGTPAAHKDETRTNEDQEILKSKREREAAASGVEADDKRFDGVDALKRKLEREDVATSASLERQATERLRTKLQEGNNSDDPAGRLSVAEHPRAALELFSGSPAAPRARPTRPSAAQRPTNRSGRSPHASAAMALVSAAVPDLVEPRKSQTQVRCRVVLWRGYVKAQFYAVEQFPTPARVLALSPLFWNRGGDRLPPKAGAAGGAHATLIEYLERDGWRVVARGFRWFDVELERADEPPPRTP